MTEAETLLLAELVAIRQILARPPPDRSSQLSLLSGDFIIQEETVTVGMASTQLVGENNQRWALILSNTLNNNLFVSTQSPVVANKGIFLTANEPFLAINFRDYGALVTVAWYGIGGAVGQNVQVVEVLYRPAGR